MIRMRRFGIVAMMLTAVLGCMPAFSMAEMTPEIDPEENGETYFSFTITPGEGAAQQEAGDTGTPAQATETAWNYPISREILEDPLDLLVLVNKEVLLDRTYPPMDDEAFALEDAKVKKSKGNEMLVRKVAQDALISMFDAAEADGAKLRIFSAYRSYQTQATMHENRVNRIGKDDGVVQAPGASDHQTGLGFDILNASYIDKSFTRDFADTTEGKWMAANCARFGFIIRYPDGKQDITGIMFEPWHLRYVGAEVATYMTEQGLTLEEFTEEWQQVIANPDAVVPPTADTTTQTVADNGETEGDVDAVVDSFSF